MFSAANLINTDTTARVHGVPVQGRFGGRDRSGIRATGLSIIDFRLYLCLDGYVRKISLANYMILIILDTIAYYLLCMIKNSYIDIERRYYVKYIEIGKNNFVNIYIYDKN